jgi:hypothetical protein
MSILEPAYIPPGPIASAFIADRSRRAVIVGPYGSGKTNAALLRLYMTGLEQNVSDDGVAYSRFIVTRLTRPQLVTAVVESFLRMFPEEHFGTFERAALRAQWRFRPAGFNHDVDISWQFLALETDEDIGRLLGVEATGIFIDEARLIDPALLGKMTSRLRFPVNAKWRGILLATNPWDTSHPFHEMFVLNRNADTAFFHQPGGLDKDGAGNYIGENLQNLAQSGESLKLPWNDPRRRLRGVEFYENQLADMRPEDALTGVHGRFGVSREGRPVYGDFSFSLHAMPLKYDPALPLHLGTDFGLNSATVIAQQTLEGHIRILAEYVTEDQGTVAHHEKLRMYLAREFPNHRIGRYTGDPAGNQRGADGRTTFQLVRQFFPSAQPANTNELALRHDAVNSQFRRMVRGVPALAVDSKRCPMLLAACVDKYFYKRLRGTEKQYSETVEKNRWSHVGEALGYLCLGAGCGKAHVLAGSIPGGPGSPRWPQADDGTFPQVTPRSTWSVF